MDFSDQIILVYLEEDNTQRAFFRIRPLLRKEGPLTAQQIAEFPDDGFLRIVPDKDEQHTFKERMRALSGVCILNLKNVPVEANKIRTNKNYAPSRGESNQFIVYSDAVQPVPQDEFYEVVAPENAASAVTPFIFTRVGGKINGPIAKESGEEAADGQKLPPDSAGLFAVTLPGGAEKLFYWPSKQASADENIQETAPKEEIAQAEEEEPAVPEALKPEETPQAAEEKQTDDEAPMTALEQIQRMDEGLKTSINRLDAPAQTFTPAAQMPKQLTGTPLYQAGARRPILARAHNPLIETVESQRLNARYEAPGAQVNNVAQMKNIDNPISQLKRMLTAVWQDQSTQRQTVDIILQMPNMREMVAKTISAGGDNLALAAMQAQLQDLEAERLMTLMQTEDIKKNAQAARDEAAKSLTQEQNKALSALKKQAEQARIALDQLKLEREKLLDDRDKVLDEIAEKADADNTLRLAPQGAEESSPEVAASQAAACLKARGFSTSLDEAYALLIAYALADGQMGVSAPTKADAVVAARALSHALGAACVVDDYDDIYVYGGGDAPCFVLSDFATLREDEAFTRLIVGDVDETTEREYDLAPYGVCSLSLSQSLPQNPPVCQPINACGLRSNLLDKETELCEDAAKLLTAVRAAMQEAGYPLPLKLFELLIKFVRIAQQTMNGGIAAALDLGLLIYVLPYMAVHGVDGTAIKELCAALPRMLRAL